MLKTISLLLVLAPAAAVAQDATGISGPVAGFVFDAALHALRPIVGVPGASYLGEPAVTDIDRAVVSPDGASALAVRGGRVLFVSGLRSAAPASAALDCIEGVDRIAWSPGGAVAAVYSSGSRQAQIIRDLPSAALPQRAIGVPDPVTTLAVSSAGDLIVGMESGLFLLDQAGAARLLAPATRPLAVSFRGQDLFVADAAGRILAIENFAAAPAVSLFTDAVTAPVGLQVSADGKRLFVAGAGASRLIAFDVAGRYAVGEAVLDSPPAELRGSGGRNLWLLNPDRSAAEPLYIATGEGDPAVWFVPDGRRQ